MVSDGITARIGSLTADYERFMSWRTITGADLAPKGAPELETLVKGVFDKRLLLDLVKDFIVFGETDTGLTKVLAGYHRSTPCDTLLSAHWLRQLRTEIVGSV